MSAQAEHQLSPEWEDARVQWYEQARKELAGVHAATASAEPGEVPRETVYVPMHDIAGLAGVFGYDLIGRIARNLTEVLRHGPDILDQRLLAVTKAHLAALTALHAKDLRGEGGASGEAILAKLASLSA